LPYDLKLDIDIVRIECNKNTINNTIAYTKLKYYIIESKNINTKKEAKLLKCEICFLTNNKIYSESIFCKHQFCNKCINKWIENNVSCPICRTPYINLCD
jgi:hypothetical protein